MSTNIKTAMKASLSLVLAATFLTTALANSKSEEKNGAEKRISFKGYLQGHETDVFQGPSPGTISVDGNVTGIAIQLGQFTLTYKVTVDTSDGSSTGSAELIAANGDSIVTSLVGQGEPTVTPDLNQIVEINTITGGTGRFAGAKGSFTVKRLVDLATGFTSGSLHGTISFPNTRR